MMGAAALPNLCAGKTVANCLPVNTFLAAISRLPCQSRLSARSAINVYSIFGQNTPRESAVMMVLAQNCFPARKVVLMLIAVSYPIGLTSSHIDGVVWKEDPGVPSREKLK